MTVLICARLLRRRPPFKIAAFNMLSFWSGSSSSSDPSAHVFCAGQVVQQLGMQRARGQLAAPVRRQRRGGRQPQQEQVRYLCEDSWRPETIP